MQKHSQQYLPPMPLEGLRTATQTPADSLRNWRDLTIRALGRASLSRKAAASEMGISEQQLSDQLNGRDNCHLSFWRMHALPKEFWQELVLLLIEFHGLTVGGTRQDQEDAAIGRCVREAVMRVVGR